MNNCTVNTAKFYRNIRIAPTIGVILLVVLLTMAFSGTALAGIDAGDDVTADWEQQGEMYLSGFGYSLDNVGDVDADGYDDVIIGSYQMNRTAMSYQPEDSNIGRVYIFKGGNGGLQSLPAYQFSGENAVDWFGYAVSDGGDLNGDDIADFIVSAPLADSSSAVTDTGKVYVYLGQSGAAPQQVSVLVGEAANDRFGIAVSGAGDVNGDGLDDFVVGAHYYDKTSVDQEAGKAYLYYGAGSGIVSTAAWTFVGENARDNLGYAVAGAGDVNGDGFADVIVGAPKNSDAGEYAGKLYLFYGSASGLPSTPSLTLTGSAANDEFGAALDLAGDVNGDGYDDIVVGAYHNEDVGYNAGKAYVYLGSPSGLVAPGVIIGTAERAGDEYGFAVDAAGDVNNDGFDDVIVGAHRYDIDPGNATADNGKFYLYSGCIGGSAPTPMLSTTGNNNRFGRSVSSAGDINQDGYDDVMAGAWAIFGKAYAYHGADVGACAVSIDYAVSVGLVGRDEPCSTSSAEIGLPVGAKVNICYRATNNGTVPIAWNSLSDSLWGKLIDHNQTEWQPNETRTYLVTATVTSDLISSAIWDGGTPITTPTGAPTNPPNKELSVSRSASVTITVLSNSADSDGDGIIDSVEGICDNNENNIPAYMDAKELGCASIQLTQGLAVQGFPSTYTTSGALQVPRGATVSISYIVKNTGNLVLTEHLLTGLGADDVNSAMTMSFNPGSSYTVTKSHTFVNSEINNAMWAAWTPLLPSNVDVLDFSTATITVSSDTDDSDGDGIPDNQEQVSDDNNNGIPAYLDSSEGDKSDGVYLPMLNKN